MRPSADLKVEPFIRAQAAERHNGLSSSMWPSCGRVLENYLLISSQLERAPGAFLARERRRCCCCSPPLPPTLFSLSLYFHLKSLLPPSTETLIIKASITLMCLFVFVHWWVAVAPREDTQPRWLSPHMTRIGQDCHWKYSVCMQIKHLLELLAATNNPQVLFVGSVTFQGEFVHYNKCNWHLELNLTNTHDTWELESALLQTLQRFDLKQ